MLTNLLNPQAIKSVIVTICMVAIASLLGVLSWRINTITKERDAALVTVGVQKKSMDELTSANLTLQGSINEIIQKQRDDEETRKRVEDQVAQINRSILSQREELRKLGESNATVRSYLNTPVPPELRSLYNNAASAAAASGASKNILPASSGQAR